MRIEFDGFNVKITTSKHVVFNRENNSVICMDLNAKEKVINTVARDLKLFINSSMDIVETFSNCDDLSYSMTIDEYCEVNNTIIVKDNNRNINKHIDVLGDVSLNEILVDLGESSSKVSMNIDLNGEHINCYNRVACMASSIVKNYDIRVNHNTSNSSSKLDNYGVATLNGELHFKATGSIGKECSKSSMLQNNKIILFDDESKGDIEPLLLIDNNDVNASHAAAVGKVDDNQIFYLCSRGISESNAKKMIALGYLTPVLEYIKDVKVKDDLSNIIAKI